IIPHVLFRNRSDSTARIPWSALLRGIALGAALYLPWFLWAWWYYGSPIPHTITAKSGITPPIHFREFLLTPWNTILGKTLLVDLFLPTYWLYGGWPAPIRFLGYVLSVTAAFL